MTNYNYRHNNEMGKANHTLPRMRTIKESFNEIKALDPNTSISEHSIRMLAKDPYIIEQGIVKFAGSRALFNLDRLIDYYKGGY